MRDTETLVKLSAQLYDMRARVRRLLGDNYKPRIAELGKVLTKVAEENGRPVLEEALAIAKNRELNGIDLLLVMAAAVELVEPLEGK